jgi:hypothetical protein
MFDEYNQAVVLVTGSPNEIIPTTFDVKSVREAIRKVKNAEPYISSLSESLKLKFIDVKYETLAKLKIIQVDLESKLNAKEIQNAQTFLRGNFGMSEFNHVLKNERYTAAYIASSHELKKAMQINITRHYSNKQLYFDKKNPAKRSTRSVKIPAWFDFDLKHFNEVPANGSGIVMTVETIPEQFSFSTKIKSHSTGINPIFIRDTETIKEGPGDYVSPLDIKSCVIDNWIDLCETSPEDVHLDLWVVVCKSNGKKIYHSKLYNCLHFLSLDYESIIPEVLFAKQEVHPRDSYEKVTIHDIIIRMRKEIKTFKRLDNKTENTDSLARMLATVIYEEFKNRQNTKESLLSARMGSETIAFSERKALTDMYSGMSNETIQVLLESLVKKLKSKINNLNDVVQTSYSIT